MQVVHLLMVLEFVDIVRNNNLSYHDSMTGMSVNYNLYLSPGL